MNIAARAELMRVLTELSELQPYYRLGQLVALLAARAGTPYRDPVVDIEDDELLPAAKEYLASIRELPAEYLAEQIRLHLEADAPVAGRPG